MDKIYQGVLCHTVIVSRRKLINIALRVELGMSLINKVLFNQLP